MADNKAPKAEGGKAMTKSAIYQELADSSKLTKKQVAEFFDALAGDSSSANWARKAPACSTSPVCSS